MDKQLPLKGWTVAVPESRQLDVLTDMLTVRGATAVRCPLVSIHDSPNDAAIKAWLEVFCTSQVDDFIILTGEGIRRLTGFAERFGMAEPWQLALTRVRKIARGPKPASALRPLNTKPDVLACAPTTDGVIATLEPEVLTGRTMAVQLYGEVVNQKLQDFLIKKGAQLLLVAPYVYASDAESTQVVQLIQQIMAKHLDVLVLTSVVQINRLVDVAKKEGCEEALMVALKHTIIAAIGPIVAERLVELKLPVTLMPDDKFFMKPLVRKLVTYVQKHPKASAK